jgi:hypothetical protein
MLGVPYENTYIIELKSHIYQITKWNQWEKVISSLDSYFCWSPPVVLGHTVCWIGPKYIFHTGGMFIERVWVSFEWQNFHLTERLFPCLMSNHYGDFTSKKEKFLVVNVGQKKTKRIDVRCAIWKYMMSFWKSFIMYPQSRNKGKPNNFDTLTNNVLFLFLILHLFKYVALLCIYIIVIIILFRFEVSEIGLYERGSFWVFTIFVDWDYNRVM